jgi:hypothetical protein
LRFKYTLLRAAKQEPEEFKSEVEEGLTVEVNFVERKGL